LAGSARNVVRAGLSNPEIEFVAANDLTDTKTLAHLLKYDSILGRLKHEVRAEGDSVHVAGKHIRFLHQGSSGESIGLVWACK